MDKSQMDPFSRYVRRRMREQHLSRRDVSARSGGKIGESYVGAIIKGKCTNVSIDKLVMSADVAEIARLLVQLSPRERSGVSKFVRRLINERARQAKHRPKRQRQ